jgi:hypothetical protein
MQELECNVNPGASQPRHCATKAINGARVGLRKFVQTNFNEHASGFLTEFLPNLWCIDSSKPKCQSALLLIEKLDCIPITDIDHLTFQNFAMRFKCNQ